MTKKKTMLGLGVLLAALMAASLITASCAPKAPAPTMKPVTLLFNLGIYAPTSIDGITAKQFGDEVTKRTNGLINFKYAYSFSLTKPGEEINAVKTKVADLGEFPSPYYPSALFLSSCGLVAFFGPSDPNISLRIQKELIYGKDIWIKDEVEATGVKWLTATCGSEFTIESRKPITKLEDLKGLKVAISGTYAPKMMEAAGAIAPTLPIGDRSAALQTGMIDASAIPPAVSFPYKLYDFCKYSIPTGWGTGWTNQHYVMNRDLFESFPKDIQKVLLEVGKEVTAWHWEGQQKQLMENTEIMKKAGVTFYPGFTLEEKVRWANMAGEPVLDWVKAGEALGKPAKALMKKLFSLCKEEGHKWPKEWRLE